MSFYSMFLNEEVNITPNHVLKYLKLVQKGLLAKDLNVSEVGSKGEWTVDFIDSKVGNITFLFKNKIKSNKKISSALLIGYSLDKENFASIPSSITSMKDVIKNYQLFKNLKGVTKTKDKMIMSLDSGVLMSGDPSSFNTEDKTYSKGTFGYWWTVVQGNEDISGVNYNIGSIYCHYNNLTSLQGAPSSVSGDFYCHYNNLTSLQGAPSSVSGDFYCHYNNLTSLQGAPSSVSGEFRCHQNETKFTNDNVKFVSNVKGDISI